MTKLESKASREAKIQTLADKLNATKPMIYPSHQTNPNRASVFIDLDGTMVPTHMHHLVWFFIGALPSLRQRIVKTIMFLIVIPFVGLVSLFDEGIACHMLCFMALKNVSQHDAEIAARRGVTPLLQRLLRPAIRKRIEMHQREQGRTVAVLSGNLEVFISDFARQLQCHCLATRAELTDDPNSSASSSSSKMYTGRILGKPCIVEEKVRRILEDAQEERHSDGLIGYGNSWYDIPFLKVMKEPYAVTPSRSLRAYAVKHGWSSQFFNVKETEYASGLLMGTSGLNFILL
eukprot:GEZU01043756.1.p1 GENE.GEZU01043756.1~~GEZU01043756.1.p1  ORF type:complete len:290 (+),score=56.21 GEZU01043756.1:75-944(+)